MFMYFSFRNEADLKFNSSYANKSNFSDVLQQNATIIEDAFKRIQEKNQANIDTFGQQENDKFYADLNEEMWNSEDEGNDVEPEKQPLSEEADFGNQRVPIFADNLINKNIR